MSIYPPESVARELMLKVGRRMTENGWIASNDANISCKINANQYLTIAVDAYMNNLDDGLIIKMGLDGSVVSANAPCTPDKQAAMHAAVFRTSPVMLGVIHAQPHYATVRAIQGRPLSAALLPYTVIHLGVVPLAPYIQPGNKELDTVVSAHCKTHNALLLQNRGLMVWGLNLFSAYHMMEMAEQYARLCYDLEGRAPQLLDDAAVDSLLVEREALCLRTGGVPVGKSAAAVPSTGE